MLKDTLYHIHRNGNMDNLWHLNSKIEIDDNFENIFYKKLLEDEKILTKRYGDYDIDYIITMMEEIKSNNLVEDDMHDEFNKILNYYYFLRREKALEVGRKIFAPTAPSRFHSLFLTNRLDLHYWQSTIGDNNFKAFLLKLDGNLFVSSDKYFPNRNLTYDIQVEESKEYWQPKVKKLTPHKEYLFQGQSTIIKQY